MGFFFCSIGALKVEILTKITENCKWFLKNFFFYRRRRRVSML